VSNKATRHVMLTNTTCHVENRPVPHHAKLHFKSRFYVKSFSLLLQENEPRWDRKLSPLSRHHLRQDFLHRAEVEGVGHVVNVSSV